MANTTNFGWETPDDTDLVKDGAAAMRTLGNAIDASLVDLKGGTTGQVLSKNTNTDMDFVWTTPNVGDITEVQAGTGISVSSGTGPIPVVTNTVATAFDAKGDIVAGTGADTFTKLTVGANGTVLTANSATATGLEWTTPSAGASFVAGKNRIINGDFLINQRNFSSATADQSYGFDRWLLQANGGATYSAQTFTPGTAPVAGYESRNFARVATTGQSGSVYTTLSQRIESVRTFANQTVTISFWAKAGSGTPSISVELQQNFGTGGSPSGVVQTLFGKQAITTTWTRYSLTAAVPSISGKTLGTTNDGFLELNFWTSADSSFNTRTNSLGIQTATIDFWGVQVEAGSVATPFTTATGTLAGELAACQRYYERWSAIQTSVPATASGNSLTAALWFKQRMRIAPTITHNLTNANYLTNWAFDVGFVTGNIVKTGTVTINANASDVHVSLYFTGATWASTPNVFVLTANNGSIEASAEL